MNGRFKFGDRVLCIEGYGGSLEIGKIYTIKRHLGGKFQLAEDSEYLWFCTRFVLTTPLLEVLL